MTRLSVLPTGVRARIVLVASSQRGRADRLASLGLAPGCEVELLQRAPAYVVQAGETCVALDEEVARCIFVQRAK